MIPKSLLLTSAHMIRLIWSLKNKINPFGELIKNKSHLCVQSGMIDFHNTFAPVENWSTVSLIIMMADMAGWESRKFDYVFDFSQAPIDSDVYLHLPENWFDMLKTGLEDECIKQIKVDPCIFVINNCIVIFYFDDFCISSKDKQTIYALLINLSKTFKPTNEGGVQYYIGMNFSKDPNGTITMIQQANVILTKDEDGNGRSQEWHYRSVIGHESISLIQSMRDLIPFRYIMLEVSSVFWIECDLYNSYTTTFE